METLYLSLFLLILSASIALGVPIAAAMLAGLAIFIVYAIRKGNSLKAVLGMMASGVASARNILMAFILIGMLTASWRASGTIPSVVCYSFKAISPGWFLLAAFLVNSLISFLTGTSFGTVATMGTITMTLGNAIGISPYLSGGAIISGIFFGDRCSPVSTSALLVADITKTDIFRNISGMARTGAVPFIASCAVYSLISIYAAGGSGMDGNIIELFRRGFRIGLMPIVPAALMLLLSAMRVRTRKTLAISIASAIIIAVLYEGMPAADLPGLLVFGYRSPDPELSAIIDGGGIISMLNVSAIVAISSSYSGIFNGTPLLDGLKERIRKIGRRVPAEQITVAVAVITSMIACNQTLATMMTNFLCSDTESDNEKMALMLENSVIVISPLVPWSIAGSVPLAILGAPTLSLLAAFYLFLIPLWMIVSGMAGSRERKRSGSGT